jgi:hypothetical protein
LRWWLPAVGERTNKMQACKQSLEGALRAL